MISCGDRGWGGVVRFKRSASPEAVRAVSRLERGLERFARRGTVRPAEPAWSTRLRVPPVARCEKLLGPEAEEETARLLRLWAGRLAVEGGNLEAVLSLLIDGASFASVDRHWQRRNGWARAQLGRAVELFLEMDSADP